jgi:TRAP-type mannitol/chloroaromatic compound transport system substrate-binding protein
MLTELVEVVKILSEVSDRSQQGDEEKRKRIANYCLHIENCLQQSVDQLKNGKVPNSQWSELQSYAQHLPKTIGQDIGQQAATQLSSLLLKIAKNIPTNDDISSLEQAAGQFRGLANTIIVKSIATNNPTPESENRSPITRRKFIIYTSYGTASFVGGFFLHKILPQSPWNNPFNDADKFPPVSWEMHTFLSDIFNKTILYHAPQQVCERVRKMTHGRFDITLKRTGETEEILRKVSAGDIQCGYSGVYYNTPKYRTLFFGCAIPFGLSPQEQTAWLHYKKNPNDELTFIQSIYREKLNLNVIPFPAGATGGQMGGWFKTKINSLGDLQNKVMRIPGLGADVWQKLGMTTQEQLGQPILIDEAIKRLKDGLFFAVEWTSPYDDIQLGLNEAAKFYYYPGWWEPSTTFDVQVNIDYWNKLPDSYQEIFQLACHETYISILTEYDYKNSLVLKEIPKKGVEMIRFNNDVLKAAEEQTKVLLELYAEQDPVFKEVYDEWRNFKDKIREWSKLTKIE